jgi:hypothetical protein
VVQTQPRLGLTCSTLLGRLGEADLRECGLDTMRPRKAVLRALAGAADADLRALADVGTAKPGPAAGGGGSSAVDLAGRLLARLRPVVAELEALVAEGGPAAEAAAVAAAGVVGAADRVPTPSEGPPGVDASRVAVFGRSRSERSIVSELAALDEEVRLERCSAV